LKHSTKLEGNRILNIGKIQKAVSENMVCKECVEDRETELLNSFATHLHSMDATEIKKTSVHTLVKDYKAARKKESELSGIYINSETQFGIATSITFACHSSETNTALHDCGEVNAEEAKYFVDKKEDGQRHASRANWWYELNNKMVLAMQAIGHAGRAAGTILSFLDLPRSQAFASNSFTNVERKVGKIVRRVSDRLIANALKEEIIATMKKNGMTMTYDEWISIPKETRPTVLLTVTLDMGWQKRSSGRTYDSLSGHCFAIGGETKKIIKVFVATKHCRACEIRKKNGKDKVEHEDCPANYEGSSKGMESEAIVEMIRQGYKDDDGFIVGFVCMDDDATTKSQLRLRWTDKIANGTMSDADWPRDPSGKKKADKGKLDLHMHIPYIYADPTHRKKVLRNALYLLKEKTKSTEHDERCTDGDIMKLALYWGYAVKQNKNGTFDEFMLAIEAVLEHHFNNHAVCGKWCPVNKGNTNGKYRSKEIHGKLFVHLQTVMGTYMTEEKLRQLHHGYSTQGNEAMNQSVASYAPKTKTYSTTMSLHNRVKMAASIQIVGHVEFWKQVYNELQMEMPKETASFHKYRQTVKRSGKLRTEQTAVKRQRTEQYHEKMKKALVADEKAKRKGMGTYGSGVGFHDASDINEFPGGGRESEETTAAMPRLWGI